MKISTKRLVGVLCIVGPFIALPLILAFFAISSFVFASVGSSGAASGTSASSDGSLSVVVGNIVQSGLSFLGLLAIVGVFVGIPLGIYLLVSASKEEKAALPPGGAVRDPRSGMGEASQVPAEILGWSWGAFGLGWVWGVCNNIWMSLFQFVGPLAIPIAIYLGLKGRELAWKHRAWPSVEAFQAAQKKWDFWGLVVFIAGCVFTGSIIVLITMAIVTQ